MSSTNKHSLKPAMLRNITNFRPRKNSSKGDLFYASSIYIKYIKTKFLSIEYGINPDIKGFTCGAGKYTVCNTGSHMDGECSPGCSTSDPASCY